MSDERRRNQILGLLFVGVLMAALDIAIVGPALPAIQRVFGVDERALSWVFSIYVLGNLVGTPTIAALSDRFGRRALYVVSLSGFALGSLLVAIAPSFPMLLLGRLVQGVSAGGVIPVASAVIGDTFPPERRGSALGLIGAVFGDCVLDRANYRWIAPLDRLAMALPDQSAAGRSADHLQPAPFAGSHAPVCGNL